MDALEPIKRKIYEIRSQRVMLDRDLAALYGVETKVLNQAVKRNSKRFEGDDFMFRLTKDEATSTLMRSQIVTLESPVGKGLEDDTLHLRSQIVTTNKRGGSRYLPYAFTELGVAMLSSVLKSETAINVNREIMRAFVAFRHLTIQPLPDSNAELRREIQAIRDDINDILADQNEINELTRAQLDAISDALTELQNQGKKSLALPEIGYAAIQKRREKEKK